MALGEAMMHQNSGVFGKAVAEAARRAAVAARETGSR